MEKDYSIFLSEIKSHILQSRYKAAAAVNRELILLYFQIGTQLSQKIQQAKWGSKVVQQLATDLQKEINGLRGFSYRNLMNMRTFAEAYPFLQSATAEIKNDAIGQSTTDQFEKLSQSITGQTPAQTQNDFMQSATAGFEGIGYFLSKVFFNISFTQHLLLLHKCKAVEERLFYMQKIGEPSMDGFGFGAPNRQWPVWTARRNAK